MKQILQSVTTGVTELVDVPCPTGGSGRLLVRTRRSLISAGTERMLVAFGRAGWVGKARQQPEKVRQTLDKVHTDGLLATIDAVRSKLDTPMSLGYCNAGVVLEVGAGVTGLDVGDRVVSNGPHAEVVCVPRNLCARVPEGVSDDEAAFAVIGAIALQGLRLAQPTLGEAVVVMGLGLVGQLTVQLLQAHGCRVLGMDPDRGRLELAQRLGAETAQVSEQADPLGVAEAFSRGRGVDAVLLTAATPSNEPLRQAAKMARKRGRIVVVGTVGLEVSRDEFYEKELTFQISCSYGPGRYDPEYEEAGHDYPLGFVRWTEQRNLEAVLDMMAAGRLDLAPLVSHRFDIGQAPQAYELLVAGGHSSLGILLDYPDEIVRPDAELRERTVHVSAPPPTLEAATPVVAVIGAGNYASRVLVPALQKTGARLKGVASSGGLTGAHLAHRVGFEQTTTDVGDLLADPEINAVVIATRHDSHARLTRQALNAGKHVFVEKPLAINEETLAEIEAAYEARVADGTPPILMVGFNRRFAPHVQRMQSLLAALSGPKAMVMTINAGPAPATDWTQDPEVGGGRIIGEGCHFLDLLRFLAGVPIVSAQAHHLSFPAEPARPRDTASFTLSFADGSIGTVHYLANGHKSFPKERLEVFCAGRVLQLNNFRRLTGYGWPGFRKLKLWRQDKGQAACVAAFLDAIGDGTPSPIPFEELVEVTRATFAVAVAR